MEPSVQILATFAGLARMGVPITRASVADRAPTLHASPHAVALAEGVRLRTLDAVGAWAVPPFDRRLLDIPEVPADYEPVVLAVLARSCAFGSERAFAAWRLERLDRLEGRPTRIVEIGGLPVRILDRSILVSCEPVPAPETALPPAPPTFNAAWTPYLRSPR